MDISQVGKHCETKADSTLNNMKKADLIQYIRTLEHNYNVAVDFNIQQVKKLSEDGGQDCKRAGGVRYCNVY